MTKTRAGRDLAERPYRQLSDGKATRAAGPRATVLHDPEVLRAR